MLIVARSAVHENGLRVRAHDLHLDSRLPAHATSTGRVLLAALPPAELELWLAERALSGLTVHTTTDAAALRTVLQQVREHDYCVARKEHELGRTGPRRAAAQHGRPDPGRAQPSDLTPAHGASHHAGAAAALLQEAVRELRPLL